MLNSTYSEEQLDQTLSLFAKYDKDRPKPDRNLDQFRATEKTVLRRATVLGGIDGISEKKLLFLGDNDLTSLVFSTFHRAGEVTVVDIDNRLLDFMGDVAENEGLHIELIEHDLRLPLEKATFNDYDVVFLDPPYTPQAANAWLARAIESTLGSGSNKKRKKSDTLTSKSYLLCYGYTNRSSERGLKIQQIITSLGLVIQEKVRGFNEYYGAGSIGSRSDLYVLSPTPKVGVRQLDVARSQFYTGHRKRRESNH